MVEHVKSTMSNAKQGNSESVVYNKPEYADGQLYVPVNSKTAHPPPPGNPRAFDSR